MKVACAKVATKLCFELFHRFPNVEIMAALGMVYPQYWMCEKTTMNNFEVDLDRIKATFCVDIKLKGEVMIYGILD